MNRQHIIRRLAGRGIFLTAAIAVFGFSQTVFGQCVSLTGPVYTENFTGNLFAPSTVPTGWSFGETGTGSDTTLANNTGGTATANTYAYGGAAMAASFGEVTSDIFLSRFGACFTNNTGFTIGTLTVGYTGEQWRSGGPVSSGVVDRLDFQYILGNQTVGNDALSWIDANSLDFNSPINNEAAAAIVRSRPDDDVPVSSSITGLSVPVGSSFTIRWRGFDRPGAPDHGLAVDSFNISGAAAPTAAPVQIGGRVFSPRKTGVANARITLTDTNGVTRIVLTNAFGYYRFGDVSIGDYIISVSSKRWRFFNNTQFVTLIEDMPNIDFVATQ